MSCWVITQVHPQKKVEFAPLPEVIESVVDYPLSSESEDEETLVLVPVSGGGYYDVLAPAVEDVVACEEAEEHTSSVLRSEEPGFVESLSEDEISDVSVEDQGSLVTEPESEVELVESESESEVEVVESSESVIEESSEYESVESESAREDSMSESGNSSLSDVETPVKRPQRDRRAPDRYSPSP